MVPIGQAVLLFIFTLLALFLFAWLLYTIFGGEAAVEAMEQPLLAEVPGQKWDDDSHHPSHGEGEITHTATSEVTMAPGAIMAEPAVVEAEAAAGVSEAPESAAEPSVPREAAALEATIAEPAVAGEETAAVATSEVPEVAEETSEPQEPGVPEVSLAEPRAAGEAAAAVVTSEALEVAEEPLEPREPGAPGMGVAEPTSDPEGATPSSAARPKDDLKIIEGIGPVMERVLNEAGIYTFAELAAHTPESLQKILDAAGVARITNPETWAEQAKLAAEGRWEELKALQAELKGGRRVKPS